MKNTTLFIETLKIVNGLYIRPETHIQRIQHTQLEFFGKTDRISLDPTLIPADKRSGTVKCRITYDQTIQKIEFESYHPRTIHSLALVDGTYTDYHLKYADRNCLHKLLQLRGKCDDILIYRNNQITDTSYSNIVLYDGVDYVTPSTYLLNGLKRQYLLQQGKIKEKDISIPDLPKYQRLYLINALLDIEDNISVDPQHIHLNPRNR